MSKFKKELFTYHGGYLAYEGIFVARFKYVNDSTGFKNFLINNFTQDEYFAELAKSKAPAEVLEAKGYLPRHVKDQLARCGYPETVEGKHEYVRYLASLSKAA